MPAEGGSRIQLGASRGGYDWIAGLALLAIRMVALYPAIQNNPNFPQPGPARPRRGRHPDRRVRLVRPTARGVLAATGRYRRRAGSPGWTAACGTHRR